jgi:hypothetical protein
MQRIATIARENVIGLTALLLFEGNPADKPGAMPEESYAGLRGGAPKTRLIGQIFGPVGAIFRIVAVAWSRSGFGRAMGLKWSESRPNPAMVQGLYGPQPNGERQITFRVTGEAE